MYNTEVTQASNFVEGVDFAFLLILGISFFFLIALTAAMVFFIIKYNAKKHPKPKEIHGSNTLEIVWTVIPFLLTLLMFYYGWIGWSPMTKPPKDSMEVTVYGRMWNFLFEYENGRKSDTLFLPKGQPVKLNLVALDVLHSLYIPAFRVKQDMVPGKEDNFMWFEPQKEGTYEIFCAEYCGLQHSYMYSWAKVLEDSTFQSWYQDTTQVVAAIESPTAAGKRIMQNIGCFACHTLDGSKLVGPSFKGIYGTTRTVKTGREKREIVADDAYIINSIYDPASDVVDGYSKGLMLSYEGQLSDEDIGLIIEYLKTVK